MIVHQLLSGAGPHDAVTQQALAYRALFDRWGWDGTDLAAAIDPRMKRRREAARAPASRRRRRAALPLLRLRAEAARRARAAPAQAARLAQHHARALACGPTSRGARCSARVGRSQLPRVRPRGRPRRRRVRLQRGGAGRGGRARDGGAADPVRPRRGSARRLPARGRAAPPTVLFVGRLTPHKRQDAVIRAFAPLPARARAGRAARARRVAAAARPRRASCGRSASGSRPAR